MRQLYMMDNIVRYSTVPKHKNETVAAHSFYVALFAMMLCDELKLSKFIKEKAVTIALVHDIPEIVTNDVTYEAKLNMPEVSDCLMKYEKKFIKANFPEVYDAMYESYFEDDKIAREIVNLADVLSVLQFCDYETNMGNSYLLGWDEETRKRIESIKEKLERMGVKCQKITI